MDIVTRQEFVPLDDEIRVYLYGEGETATVTLRPEEIDLGKTAYNVEMDRELLISNRLLFAYKNICQRDEELWFECGVNISKL